MMPSPCSPSLLGLLRKIRKFIPLFTVYNFLLPTNKLQFSPHIIFTSRLPHNILSPRSYICTVYLFTQFLFYLNSVIFSYCSCAKCMPFVVSSLPSFSSQHSICNYYHTFIHKDFYETLSFVLLSF